MSYLYAFHVGCALYVSLEEDHMFVVVHHIAHFEIWRGSVAMNKC